VRALKWISLVLAGLIALTIVFVLVVVWLVDPNRFKARIESAVKEATGRDFALAGDIDLGFFPWLALRTGEGHFGNAPGFDAEPMVSWKSAQLGAKLFPLLRGELVADRVMLNGADVRLVRHKDGRANWEGIGGNKPVDPDAKPMELRIDGVRIENSRVSFVDETVPRRIGLSDLNLTTDGIEPGKPYTDTAIAGVLHMDGFAPEGVTFRLEVPKAVVPRDFSALAVEAFKVQFGGLVADGRVSGTLGAQPKLQGTIESNVFDPRVLLSSVGVAAPKTTDLTALGKVQFAGTWGFDAGAIVIDPLKVTLDDTHLSGNFRRASGEDPVGGFTLRGDTLDLSRYVPPPDPASEPFVLPTAMLKQLKFRGVVELEQATYDDIVMKGVTLRLLLDDQGLRSEQPR
jgi:AsmA protein